MPETYRLRPCSPEEADLFYSGSPREDAYLGHIRGAFGDNGTISNAAWFNRRHETDEAFSEDASSILAHLKLDLLKDRASMARYMDSHPTVVLEPYPMRSLGYAISTERFDFFVRCCANRGEYNFYIFCYRREDRGDA